MHSLRNKKFNFLFIFILLSFIFSQTSFAQEEPLVPQELLNLPVTSRVIQKDFTFEVSDSTSDISQNLVADNTGKVVHITNTLRRNRNIIIQDSDGNEVTQYHLSDGTSFALVDSEKTYDIIQEESLDCKKLIMGFVDITEENTICPDSILVRRGKNLSFPTDTSLFVSFLPINQRYLGKLMLQNEVQAEDSLVDLSQPENELEELLDLLPPKKLNISELLNKSELCILSSQKSKNPSLSNSCSFTNRTQTILKFNADFTNKELTQETNIVFAFPKGIFNRSDHQLFLNTSEAFETENLPVQFEEIPGQKLFFENYTYDLINNLGFLDKAKTKVKKNRFILEAPIEVDRPLSAISFSPNINSSDISFQLINNATNENTLTEVTIKGSEEDTNTSFAINTTNNIVLKDLSDEEVESNSNFDVTGQQNLVIMTFIPDGVFDITLDRKYSLVEQNIQPSVDDSGSSIELVNDKALLDLTFSKTFTETTINDTTRNIELTAGKANTLLSTNTFNTQLPISGFLIPPDFRPVIQENYRATINFSMSLELNSTESLDITYEELFTKDEIALTNFFKFTHLPLGEYNATLNFNGDREALFTFSGIDLESSN